MIQQTRKDRKTISFKINLNQRKQLLQSEIKGNDRSWPSRQFDSYNTLKVKEVLVKPQSANVSETNPISLTAFVQKPESGRTICLLSRAVERINTASNGGFPQYELY